MRLALELEGAVAGADRDGQGIHAGALYKILHLSGVSVRSVGGADIDGVLDAGQTAKLRFHGYVPGMGVVSDLFCQLHVLLIGQMRAVDHHGGEAAVDAVLAQLEGRAMIQMERDGQAGFNFGGLYQLGQIGVVGVLTGAGGHLKNHGSVQLLAGFGNSLHDFHIVHIECADGIAFLVSPFEHFSCVYQRHFEITPV